eukprot:743286-Pleurochrysis_carterae.AAC.6
MNLRFVIFKWRATEGIRAALCASAAPSRRLPPWACSLHGDSARQRRGAPAQHGPRCLQPPLVLCYFCGPTPATEGCAVECDAEIRRIRRV